MPMSRIPLGSACVDLMLSEKIDDHFTYYSAAMILVEIANL